MLTRHSTLYIAISGKYFKIITLCIGDIAMYLWSPGVAMKSSWPIVTFHIFLASQILPNHTLLCPSSSNGVRRDTNLPSSTLAEALRYSSTNFERETFANVPIEAAETLHQIVCDQRWENANAVFEYPVYWQPLAGYQIWSQYACCATGHWSNQVAKGALAASHLLATLVSLLGKVMLLIIVSAELTWVRTSERSLRFRCNK